MISPRTSLYPSLLAAALMFSMNAGASETPGSALEQQIRQDTAAIQSQLIAWRRDIHQHPELGEQETRTAKLVADHLKKLGLEVRTGVGRTGVVGILRGGKPGRTVALRADMDALPVKEPEGLPFASKARGVYHGTEVDVMHACGHDAHTAMLMAAADVLTGHEGPAGRHGDVHLPAGRRRLKPGPAGPRRQLGRRTDAEGRLVRRPQARRGLRPACHAGGVGGDQLA